MTDNNRPKQRAINTQGLNMKQVWEIKNLGNKLKYRRKHKDSDTETRKKIHVKVQEQT